MSTISTVIRISRHSLKGVTLKDKWCALLLAGLPLMGHYRVKLREWWLRQIDNLCSQGQLTLNISINNRPVRFNMRKGNEADYMIGGELVGEVYQRPNFTPEFIVDGGSNIGMFAVLANAYFPNVPINCYEPDEDNFNQLQINLQNNGVNARPFRLGLWSSDTTLYYHKLSSQIGFIDENPPGVAIPCTLPDIQPMTWLKLDIEASEYEVLPALFRKNAFPLWISMEVHYMVKNGKFLIDLLKTNGYLIEGDDETGADCYVIDAILKK